jgi:hypothetical protein
MRAILATAEVLKFVGWIDLPRSELTASEEG